MTKPLLILKPSIINSIVPTFLKKLFYSLTIILILYGISIALKTINIIDYPPNRIAWSIILLIIITTVPLIIKTVILSNTKYYFYRTYISKEFEFLIIKKESTPYNQIVNITIDISIWDRVCKAGDLILHTAEDKKPDLVLAFIKNPEKIEKNIYKLLNKNKKTTS